MLFPLLAAGFILIYIFLKLPFLSVRLSDTNIYAMMASQLTQGKLLYSDMFLTNAPMFPYIAVLYRLITGGNLTLFYATTLAEIAGIGLLLFLIVEKLTKSRLFAVVAVGLYLNTFIVMATANHQTGVFTATLFATGAYYFFIRKHWIISGTFLGAMLMTKGYFLPVAAGFAIYLLAKDWKSSIKLLVTTGIVCIVILLPTLLFSRDAFFEQVFGYSLNRGAGLDKLNIFMFFIRSHWVILLSASTLFIIWKKIRLELLIIGLSVLFLSVFKDIYFFYLNMILPFLVITITRGIQEVTKRFNNELLLLTFIAAAVVQIIFTWQMYFSSYHEVGKVHNVNTLVKTIQKANPDVVYGETDFTPALSYLSGVPLMDGIIDTNANLFRSGVYNSNELTKDIFKQKTVVVTFGALYPQLQVNEQIVSEIMEKEVILQKCELLQSEPILAEGVTNRINLFRCY